jgi:hypothetical protein
MRELWLPICSFQPWRAAMRKTAAMSQRISHSVAEIEGERFVSGMSSLDGSGAASR